MLRTCCVFVTCGKHAITKKGSKRHKNATQVKRARKVQEWSLARSTKNAQLFWNCRAATAAPGSAVTEMASINEAVSTIPILQNGCVEAGSICVWCGPNKCCVGLPTSSARLWAGAGQPLHPLLVLFSIILHHVEQIQLSIIWSRFVALSARATGVCAAQGRSFWP